MRRLPLLLLLLVPLVGEARGVRVRAHSTKRGTYVKAHHRSSPDHSKRNNWSSKGSVNPYTGKRGTR